MKKCWVLVSCFFLISNGYVFAQSNSYFIDSNKNKAVSITKPSENYAIYLKLLKEHESIQDELLNSTDYYKKIRKKNYVLTGKDISIINTSFTNRLNLLNRSLTFSSSDLNFSKTSNLYNLVSIHLKIKSFETFVLQQNILGKNTKVNILINEDNLLYREKKNSLKKIKNRLTSKRFRKSLQKAWNNSKIIDYNGFDSIKAIALTDDIIKTHYYQNMLSNSKSNRNSKKYFNKLISENNSFLSSVSFNYFLNNFLSGFSNLVGNFLGFISTRKGKLYNNIAFRNTSLALLQPLDVLLEKTPFRLTDKFIPGYWGHAAIYVGNENQLKELNIWNHPFVKKYHNEIREGKVIVEALRSSVAINTFKNFTNIDDFVHLRLNDEPALEKKREMIIKVFAQIGKKYDFGYNIESNKKIICSELHYLVFDQVKFKTNRVLGINSLSVDQIAEQGIKGGAFYPIALYLNGIKVKDDKIFEIYDQLLKARKKENKSLKKDLFKRNTILLN